ncbi:MAG: zf-TFIIB domain-containing protein [Verrucomicrobia bacterium]|nr:zf-TFIIB domain-containing protein [Verrucomicrobiota bacterium]
MSESATLLCPVDKEPLVSHPHGVGEFHHCTACRGLWIPRTFLLSLKAQAARTLSRNPTLDPRTPVIHEEPIHCLECNAELLPRIHDHVPIDLCAACKAVWLDGDELLQMAKTIKPRQEITSNERDTVNGYVPASRGFADLGTAEVVLAAELVGAAVIALLD